MPHQSLAHASIAAVAALLCAAALSSTGGCSNAAAVADAAATDGGLYRLGTGRYMVTATVPDRDDCQRADWFGGALYDLEIDNNTGRITLTRAGPTVGCTASVGCGVINNNTGTLTVTTDVGSSACSLHRTTQSTLTLVGDLTFTLAVVEQETMRVNCMPPGDACTSTFTLTFAPLGPDAGSAGE